MADLITLEQLTARFAAWGLQLPDDPSTLIEDASAVVGHVAETDFEDVTVPGVIVTIVAQVIRRALENPGELTGEQIGAYGWQNQHAGAPTGAAMYLTRAERKMVREAAGRPAVRTIHAETGLVASSYYGVDIDDVPL